ncbi:hypothetical protein DV096_16150 [Bradymonadaceae bacterium TMQ3]|uniref:Uncharacterized protein n=1 Tax=Lujinxingia sediminis TaxID=2480984 RepID=A0ABY0CR79_9DELT|nr:hypothetical protein DV096_16150 [Bradymonadaceae bacterium TMQ3]RVU43015.1 hypothetical protein EA187_13645 [Lujinxingia sediminis]TXC73198.1 hypothetical protein FRC91_17095 [Bradymonadales bacterium TMQ1]
MPHLLAIDLGLRCGFATYTAEGRLLRYRSTNFGSKRRLRDAAWAVLRDEAPLAYLVLEGDRGLAEIWQKTAARQGAETLQVAPEHWREALLLDRQQRSGAGAKAAADQVARQVIAWSGAPAPTTLRHDAAEAILIGLWGVHAVGWLSAFPERIAT